jgi:hypothetical protein
MERILLRVVCGLFETMEISSPIKWFINVDLPTLGRPINDTKPE